MLDWSVWMLAIGSVWVVVLLIRLFPDTWWARLLLSTHGPRTDVARMTRHDCLRAAGGFALIAALALATLIGLVAYAEWLDGPTADPYQRPALGVLVWTYALVLLMGLGGAAYLLLRAPFRPRTLRPTEGADSQQPSGGVEA